MNDILNRLEGICEDDPDNPDSPGAVLASYTYLGAGAVVQEDYSAGGWHCRAGVILCATAGLASSAGLGRVPLLACPAVAVSRRGVAAWLWSW